MAALSLILLHSALVLFPGGAWRCNVELLVERVQQLLNRRYIRCTILQFVRLHQTDELHCWPDCLGINLTSNRDHVKGKLLLSYFRKWVTYLVHLDCDLRLLDQYNYRHSSRLSKFTHTDVESRSRISLYFAIFWQKNEKKSLYTGGACVSQRLLFFEKEIRRSVWIALWRLRCVGFTVQNIPIALSQCC